MIEVRATNIISPLGMTTQENYQAIKAGNTKLMRYDGYKGIPEPITVSVFSDDDVKKMMISGYSKFESIAISSIQSALSQTDIDPKSARTVFILSTTKADIEELEDEAGEKYCPPGVAASNIAARFGIVNEPIVVCNACISGSSAQLLAKRLIENEEFDNVIVCGIDCVSKFTIAGFLSFKAMSPYECRPFDIERLGLNLGEAAATIIFSRANTKNDFWKIISACQTNDAHHVSAPSPDGDGTLKAITKIMKGFPDKSLSCICVHGTATMFNDQMESMAIQNAGLSDIPIIALKGYFGHTLGAAGIIEAIITMESLNDGIILPAKGFEEIGVGGKINISNRIRECINPRSFLKIISGFGGCNAALIYSKDNYCNDKCVKRLFEITRYIHIDNQSCTIDGLQQSVCGEGKELLTYLYKSHINDYPKFYKMDMLSKLLFTATHFLLTDVDQEDISDMSVLLFNATSSILADKKHIETYMKQDGFFPSPSVFLYTLPNIAIGEITIRHHITGETTLYILKDKNQVIIDKILNASNFAGNMIMTGWIDCSSENKFEADLKLIKIV